MNKVYIVLVGLNDKDIESAHITPEGASKKVEELYENDPNGELKYDNRGIAYIENDKPEWNVFVCEVDLED